MDDLSQPTPKALRVGVVPNVGRNIPAIRRSIRIAGQASVLVERPQDLDDVDCVVLPGIGAFDAAVIGLREAGLIAPLREFARTRPLLGVCVGAQVLVDRSEEGVEPGLGLIEGACVRIPAPGLTLPRLGWADVVEVGKPTFMDEVERPRFYFAHSFHVEPTDPGVVVMTSAYGPTSVTAAICREHVVGVQFHPEKSHRFGVAFFASYFAYARRFV